MVERLTAQEIACVRGTTEGLGNKEIAARLGVSVQTVKCYLDQAYRKLDVAGRSSPRTRAAIMLVAHDMESHTSRLLRDQ